MSGAWSLDHLVGARQQRRRHGEADGPGCPEMFELGRTSREVGNARLLLRWLGRCGDGRDGETTGDGADERAARDHSMTLLARWRMDGGSLMLRASAVLRLTTSSSSVGSWMGRSPGLAPFRIRST